MSQDTDLSQYEAEAQQAGDIYMGELQSSLPEDTYSPRDCYTSFVRGFLEGRALSNDVSTYSSVHDLRKATLNALSEMNGSPVVGDELLLAMLAACAKLFAYPGTYPEHRATLRAAFRQMDEKGSL